ncbi:MAG: type II secretion system protein N [Stenotrophomonas sp.]
MNSALSHRFAYRQWPLLAEVLLWLLLLAQLGRCLWLVAAPASSAGAPRLTVVPSEISALAGHDPFFAGDDTAAATATSGDWKLFGLRSEADGRGSAILGRDGQPQAAYRVGDAIAPGLTLTSVSADQVRLSDGSSLQLPGTVPALVAAAASPAPAASAAAANGTGLDASKLLEAGLQARTRDGRVTGYTLMPRGGSELLMRAAGLQPGDVLLSVNGQALYPEALAELGQQLVPGAQAIVTFERDGQTRTLTLGNGKP